LVLGTSKFVTGGKENLFYSYRIAAASQAYAAGKCAKVVVSGDNRHRSYNEPQTMKKSLIEQGVPAGDIYCDYAGSRTLDSVVRFKHIFGQSSGIVISQEFHNARAIYIGRANGMNLTGFNAREVPAYDAFSTKLREIFSRIRAVADVELLHSEPKHYGEKIPL
jgi:SanA protein